MSDINFLYRLGVRRRLNAAGTLTRLGGSLMANEVLEAMCEAARFSVDMAELQSAAGRRVAELMGAEAALVTSGASAAMTLACAACLAGWEAAAMAQLPQAEGMPNHMLMARTHRNTYDHAVRLAGAKIVDIGHNDYGTGAGVRSLESWEIESHINGQVVGMVFTATAKTLSDLPQVIETLHRHGRFVIVDAAAQLPPRSNLQSLIATGADLVIFSGGKAIGGPQSTGILAGRSALIGSALLQMLDMDVHPATWIPAGFINRKSLKGLPTHGIGRGFKVGKEEIAGLICALERYLNADEVIQHHEWRRRLDIIKEKLMVQPGLSVELLDCLPGAGVPCLAIKPSNTNVFRLSLALQELPVPLHLGESRIGEGLLLFIPTALRSDDDDYAVQCLLNALREFES
ncbi:MAG: aminotransferase class V-fold PLP-dependent enzyme [Betaproteobacteria bacterium]|nr:aminotransferase class V-fold PLP-dependent enzyme [Betaproteobacteria bacterium]